MLLLLLISGSVTAQNYIVLKSERIHTPWDTDSTLHQGNDPYKYYDTKISLTLDKKIVMLSSIRPFCFLKFYFYDESTDTWLKKQIDSNYWRTYPGYTIGFKRISGAGYEGTNNLNYVGKKWVFNYGDSTFLDTGQNLDNGVSAYSVSPVISYTATKSFAQERVVVKQGGSPVKPYSSNLYKRTYIDGKVTYTKLLSFNGGNPALPEYLQDYQNDIDFNAIDEETIVASVRRYYYYPALNGDGAKYNTEKYNLLTTNSGITWTRSEYNLKLPEKNADGQWFIRQEPTTYLYYSERHGITPKQPISFGFIDPHLQNVTITSEYANGTKGYYGLCNSKTDTTEKNKFLIYSITNLGTLRKFIVADSTFEYQKFVSYDSSVYEKQILYADDTLMYVLLTTSKRVKLSDSNSITYYSQPQVYKIHLPNQTNEVEEQQLSTTLQLYPNPTDQILRWNIPNGKATITDALGVEVLSVPASSMQADVSGLAIGVYYLTIRSGGESVTRVFTVMR